ncbi:hypothetical protein [Clostridium folliculivorans]|uniref:Spo0E like sporulation regulatory protein n=1 Tax=Clostridium folliculivorans TaxID=2886038 RepID=A0A9W6DB68_9CLOT|nr:hypothetical protein [Clostridium folliculivorans]GKU26115.1 hypothetical protein CFOLD11_29420 [Clostridium folliculivorans]GKU28201.1 hypothetical protein CFB3_03070 [Clostridium folliculivorans]
MDEKTLLNNITNIREKLENLIKASEKDLVSQDIIEVGNEFNDALNIYNRFISRTPNEQKG